MDLIDYTLQHPVATVAHRNTLTEANQELMKFWEQDPYVMFKDENRIIEILRALPSFAGDLEDCAISALDIHEAAALKEKLAAELPGVLVRWEHYTPVMKAVESFLSVTKPIPFNGESCRSGRLLEEMLSFQAFKILTTPNPPEIWLDNYIAYGERLIDTFEYYENQNLNVREVEATLTALRKGLVNLEVTLLVTSVD